jgi:sterol desaturase/sphingolipid hydroxylase (fatty acid hydroxylase superfamily)
VSGFGSIAAPLLFGVPLLLTALLLAETFLPLRPNVVSPARRWFIHAALYLINTLIAGVLAPERWAPGGGLIISVERAFGPVTAIILGLTALDIMFYALHRLQHASPFLWRLHKVHHSDLDVDVSTAVRHHPGEFVLSCLLLGTITVLLGIAPGIIAGYGVFAIVVEMVQHANVGWPVWAERVAAVVFVTPTLHHRHHSRDQHESDTNFGIVLSVWDRLFGSFDSCSSVTRFGVEGIDWPKCRTLWRVLVLPIGGNSRDDDAPAA